MTRPHKYGAKAVEVDGIRFPSKAQAKRYCELKLLARAGEISDLTLEPQYQLFGMGGGEICKYRADFFYRDKDGTRVVEDVKGVKTPVYRLKAKLFKDNFGFEITEVSA